MEYARYVGRVGALAVALGIGAAVANGGVAHATTDPDPSQDSSQNGEQDGSGSIAPDNTPPGAVDPSGTPAAGGEIAQNDNGGGTTLHRIRPKVMILDALRIANTAQLGARRAAAQDADPAKQEGSTTPQRKADNTIDGGAVAAFSAPTGGDPVKPALPEARVFHRTLGAMTTATQQRGTSSAQVLPGPTKTAAVINTLTDQTQRQAAMITGPSTLDAPAVPARAPKPGTFVINLLSSIGLRPDAFPPSSPLAPIGQVLEFVYAGLRRFDHTFFNETPTATPLIVDANTTTGVVTGRVATDYEGDALVYRVVDAPDNGEVVLNPDGTFTYTPNRNETHAVGETDEFTVVVSDRTNFHLHLLSPSWHETTVTVSNIPVVPNNTVIATLPSNGTFPTDIALNPAGDKLYVVYNTPSKVTVIDLANDNATHDITMADGIGNNPQTIAFSPDGTKAYVPNFSDTSVSVIDVATNTVTTFDTPKGDWDLAVLPNGHLYVVGDDFVTVVDPANPSSQTFIPLDGLKGDITLSPDGKLAYVAVFDENRVAVINTETNMVIDSIPVGEFPQDMKTNPMNGTLYVGDDEVAVVPAGSTMATHIDVPNSRGLAVSPDGTRLYVANIGFDSVSVIDTSTNTVVGEIPVPGSDDGPWRIAISPDGSRAYVLNFAGGTVSVIALQAPADPAIVV